ncbi:MAG: hypothetical protein QOI07_896 [Verrucomicrobiota bacterium]|jgi:hypothetical protein
MTTLAKGKEATALAACEEVIERGLDSFIEVGNALLQIRDQRLYRSDYDNFEVYCQERWDMSGRRAHQLIDSAKVIQNIGTEPRFSPTSERQTRPLATLPAPVQREAWQQAVDSSATGKPTAKEVEAAVEVIVPRKQERINHKPANGLQYSAQAVAALSKIQPNDTQREEAFAEVTRWLKQNR